MVDILKNKILEFHPDTVEYVRKELNLDKEGRMEEALDILASWVQKQPHFLKKDFTRAYLERTLMTSKGLVERAKLRLDKLCTFKTLMPEMYPSVVARKDYDRLLNNFVCNAHLPKMTKEYYRVYLFNLKSDDFESSDVITYYKYIILLSEYLKNNDYNSGFSIILDMRKTNILKFVSKCTPLELRQIIMLMTEGYGMRIKHIHVITPSKMVDTLIALLKQVLSSKLGGRIRLHKDIDTLYDFVPKEILPGEYGGKEKSLQELNDQWLDIITDKDFSEYYGEMIRAKTDENCRQASKFNEEYIGMPGSFRALSVD